MMSEWIHRAVRYVATTLLAVALLSVSAEGVHAQVDQAPEVPEDQPTLRYGVRLGVGVTGVQGDAVARKNRGTSPLLGTFVTYPVTNELAVQPEIAYRRHSVEVASAQQRPPQLWRYTTHFLDVPVLVKGYLPSPDNTRLYLQAGPNVAFALGSDADLAPSRTNDLPPAFGDAFSSTSVGAVVGGGLDRFIGDRLFSVDVRYTLGLTDLVTESDAPSLYKRSFDITIGIGL